MMRLVRILAGFAVLAAVVGCADAPTAQATRDASAQAPCRQEYRVGSNIPTKNCSTVSEADRERTQDELRNAIRSTGTQRGN